MDIQLQTKEYCEQCPEFKPELLKNVFYADEKMYYRSVIVRCLNQERCERIKMYLEKRILKGDKDE